MKLNYSFLFLTAFLTISFCFGQMDSYSKKIALKGIDSQWHAIEIPNDVFADVNTNMSDIRIYGVTATDTIEAPYLHKISKAENANSEISFNLLNSVNNSKGYFFTYELPQKETINEILLNIQDLNFNWEVTLEGTQDQKQWFTILEDYRILSINNDQTNYSFTSLKFPDANYRYYRVLIKSTEKPNLTSVNILKKAKKDAEYRDYEVESFKVSQENKKTIIDIDLTKRVPLNLLKLTIDDKIDYYRSISIQYLVDSVQTEKGFHYNYRPIATRTLSSMEDNSFQLPGTLANKVRVIVLNNDNQPLKISGTKLKGYVHTLTTRFTEPATYFLVYGKQNANFPNYDITKTTVSLPDKITKLGFGSVVEIPKPETEISNPLFENKWWLWVIIGVVIALLGYFTIGMMKKEL
ncbi:DUF3999 family protein [Maribacter hydrothermalis]|uniref:DUF3999 domain-containing protein n=1 Tax=Maribacter hydrothermalis TaxID=1836467 RepID=A0A1B7Z717_9FLAO|nr:DUF3999 family protein [Maribacter hydrothermalis]APQ16372.1 hypothetical protein BTR34_03025 [Maribacter hydrothermalis]OBR38474.1 hypothetical protein A9200_17535 [Maribacter hydrothermalis]